MSGCDTVVVNDLAGEIERLLILHYCVQYNIVCIIKY